MKAIYIPNGPKNLAPLFPSVDFKEVSEYYVQIRGSGDMILVTGNKNLLETCPEDYVRIIFLNSVGAIADGINFQIVSIESEIKSDSYEKPTGYPLQKSEHAINRFNVKANDIYTVRSAEYYEEQMDWIEELISSPMAWMEWKGTQGQADGYLPVVLVDMKHTKRKENDRYVYEITLQFKFSHERFNIRN